MAMQIDERSEGGYWRPREWRPRGTVLIALFFLFIGGLFRPHRGTQKALSGTGDALAEGNDGTAAPIESWQRRLLGRHRRPITAMAANPADGGFATASDDAVIQVWKPAAVDSPAVITTDLTVGGIDALAYGRGGHWLAAAGFRRVEIFDVRSLEMVTSVDSRDVAQLRSVAFTPDGNTLIAGDVFGVVLVWSLKDGKARGHFKAHAEDVTALAVSPDGRFMATGSQDKSLRLWNLRTLKLEREIGRHDWSIAALAFHPDGKRLVSAGGDAIKVWNLATGSTERTFTAVHEITSLSLDKTGSTVAVGVGPLVSFIKPRYAVQVFDLGSARELVHDEAFTGRVTGVAMSPGALLAGTDAGEVFGYLPSARPAPMAASDQRRSDTSEVPTPDLVVQTAHQGVVVDIAMSDDAHYVASVDSNGNVIIWDARSRTELRQIPGEASNFSQRVRFTLTGKLAAARGNTVGLWDVASGERLARWVAPAQDVKVALASNGLAAVTYSTDVLGDGRTDLVDLQNGAKVIATLPYSWARPVFAGDGGSVVLQIERHALGVFALDGHRVSRWDWPEEIAFLTEAPGPMIGVAGKAGLSIRSLPGGSEIARHPTPLALRDQDAVAVGAGMGLAIGYSRLGEGQHSELELFDLKKGLERCSGEGPENGFTAVAFAGNGRFVLGAALGGALLAWDAGSCRSAFLLRQEAVGAWQLLFGAHDDSQLFTLTEGSVVQWDLRRGAISDVLDGREELAPAVALLGSDWLLRERRDGQLLVAGLNKVKPAGGPLEGLADNFIPQLASAASPSGEWVAVDQQTNLGLWNARTGKRQCKLATDDVGLVTRIAFSRDGRLVAAGGSGKSVGVWEVNSCKILRSVPMDHARGVVFDAAGRRLFVTGMVPGAGGEGWHDEVAVFNLADGVKRTLLGQPPGAFLAVSPDGRVLASAGNFFVSRFSTDTLAPIGEPWKVPANVYAIAFSPNGQRLGLVCDDAQVRILDANDGQLVASLVRVGRSDNVVVTQGNHYFASPGGVRGVSFRFGDRAYPFEQFDLRLNRRDEVMKALGFADRALLDRWHRFAQERLADAHVDEKSPLLSPAIPRVSLDRPAPLSTETRTLRLGVTASAVGAPLDQLRVVVNGVPGERIDLSNRKEMHVDVAIDLDPGRNRIQISAFDHAGFESLKELADVECTAKKNPSRVFLLAVGIAAYPDQAQQLARAADDANQVYSLFAERGLCPDGAGRCVVLLDAKARADAIAEAATKLFKSAAPDDEVILFLSGHGFVQDDYRFATYDYDFATHQGGLSYRDLLGFFSHVRARRRLLVIDSCATAAGGSSATLEQGAADDERELLSYRMRDRGTRAGVVSFFGAQPLLTSGEDPKQGRFTRALLEGLRSGRTRVSKLSEFMSQAVRKETHGLQIPLIALIPEFDFEVL